MSVKGVVRVQIPLCLSPEVGVGTVPAGGGGLVLSQYWNKNPLGCLLEKEVGCPSALDLTAGVLGLLPL